MPIILPCLSDPTDIVIAGEQIIPSSFQNLDSPLSLIPIIPCEMPFARMNGDSIPRTMIGMSDWYGTLPRQIGYMALGSGQLILLDIGNPIFKSPIIDPIQNFLYSGISQDMNGNLMDMTTSLVIGSFDISNLSMVSDKDNIQGITSSLIKNELKMSGLLKTSTFPTIPSYFGQRIMEIFTDSTNKFIISGITKDSISGNPIPNCRVLLFDFSKFSAPQEPLARGVFDLIADTTSDSNGVYTIQVSNNTSSGYILISYLQGSPDKAGITSDNIIPTAT